MAKKERASIKISPAEAEFDKVDWEDRRYSYEFFNLAVGEVFPVICHFVQFLGAESARAFRHGAERFFEYGQLT